VLEFRPQKTGFGVSLLTLASGSGMLFVAALTAFFGFARLTVWFVNGYMEGISTAGIVVFDLLAACYVSRYLLVVAQTSAEGYDLPPGPPDPREVEELFGGILKLMALGFFVMLPVLLPGILNLKMAWLAEALLLIGALYIPMGLTAMAVTGEIAACFPGTVIPAIFAAPVRYLPAALCAAAAALVVSWSHVGGGTELPLAAKIGLDLVSSWLLLAALHRTGVVRREEPAVGVLVPFPEPTLEITESVLPPTRPSEIERLLWEREQEERRAGPPQKP
jgi:hypothetical protein